MSLFSGAFLISHHLRPVSRSQPTCLAAALLALQEVQDRQKAVGWAYTKQNGPRTDDCRGMSSLDYSHYFFAN